MKNPRQKPWSPTANRHRYALIGKNTVHVGGADSNDPELWFISHQLANEKITITRILESSSLDSIGLLTSSSSPAFQPNIQYIAKTKYLIAQIYKKTPWLSIGDYFL
jgi:hypothetical protein